MPEHEATWESYLEAPRWALSKSFIRQGVVDLNDEAQNKGYDEELEIIYLTEDVGLLRRCVYWKVGGPTALVKAFRDGVVAAVKAYGA